MSQFSSKVHLKFISQHISPLNGGSFKGGKKKLEENEEIITKEVTTMRLIPKSDIILIASVKSVCTSNNLKNILSP